MFISSVFFQKNGSLHFCVMTKATVPVSSLKHIINALQRKEGLGFHNSESYDFVDFLPLSNYVQVFSYFKVLTLMEATLFLQDFSWDSQYCQWQGRQCQMQRQTYHLTQASSYEIQQCRFVSGYYLFFVLNTEHLETKLISEFQRIWSLKKNSNVIHFFYVPLRENEMKFNKP